MQTTEERLIALANKNKTRGILLDTNVLLLFLFCDLSTSDDRQKAS
jgi:hypothetical protein